MNDMYTTNFEQTINLLNDLPNGYLDMNDFRKGRYTACVIGHAVELTPPEELERFRFKNGEIDFIKWSEYFYGFQWGSNEWEYLFSEKWANHTETNTKEHAIERLTDIMNGYVPTYIVDEVLATQITL